MKKSNIFRYLFLAFSIICVSESVGQDMKNNQASPSPISSRSLEQTGIVYRNPRPFDVKCSFELAPGLSNIDRAKDLKLWLPIPKEWDSQKAVKIISVQVPTRLLF